MQKMSSATAQASSSSEAPTLAQLDAASQLLAAASLLQQTHSSNSDNSSKSNNTSISPNGGASFVCQLCSVGLRSSSELEAHYHTHQQQLDNMLAPGQFNYGIHILNLLNQNSRASANNSPVPSTGTAPAQASPKPSQPSQPSVGSANIKKRKLLASQAALEQLEQSEQNRMRPFSPAKTSNDTLTQNLLAQFAHEASKAQHLNVNGGMHDPKMLANGCPSPLQAYPCTQCPKTFATEVDLKAHTLRHLTQHPFVCYSCGKGFKYNHSLHFHIKQFHNGGADMSETLEHSTKEKPLSLKRSRAREPEVNHEDALDLCESSITPTSTSIKMNGNNQNFQNSELYHRLTLMDENHNAAGSAEKTVTESSSIGLFGKPPTNLPADSSIQIRSERVLATVLEAINVHTDQSVVLYKCCLCAVAFGTLDQLSVHVSNVHQTELTPVEIPESAPTAEITCEKCSAKFTHKPEYEIHMQLHRSLEASQNAASASNASAPEVLYPFSLLSHLTSGANSVVTSTNGTSTPPITAHHPPPTLDFRHIMASASKDTDFGRKFAAQLLAGDSDTSGPHSPNSSKNKSQDSNNNSLMFLVPEPGKPPSSRAQYATQFKDIAPRIASSPITKAKTKSAPLPAVTLTTTTATAVSPPGSKKSSRASSAAESAKIATRNLKEPVDIFEGAGQSLPIQKFSVGDIQETSPGVFKCRFCEKCFDRVFSVHRHERVHTGFKPCICKTCGRGFSEKRNLRHHIIRFHSDGSGRDLLKRKRNNGKTANISNTEFLSHYDRLLVEATSGNGSVSSDGGLSEQMNSNALHMSLAMLDRMKMAGHGSGDVNSDSEENSNHNQPKLSVNRRKSATKPPQRIANHSEQLVVDVDVSSLRDAVESSNYGATDSEDEEFGLTIDDTDVKQEFDESDVKQEVEDAYSSSIEAMEKSRTNKMTNGQRTKLNSVAAK